MSHRRQTLAILSQVYVPDPAAVGQQMHDAAAEMVRRGWQVKVFTSARGYDDPSQQYPLREVIDGVSVVRLHYSSFGKQSLAHRLLGGMLFLVQATAAALGQRHLDRLLVSTSPPICPAAGVMLSLARGVPVKFWVMDINPDQLLAAGRVSKDSPAVVALDWVNRLLLQRASDVVVLDRYMAERLSDKTANIRSLEVIPPWAQVDERAPLLAHAHNPFRAQHGLAGKFVVAYSGNVSPVHPITTVLEASLSLQDDPRIVFLFIGGGAGWAELGQFVRTRRPANLRLLPYQPLSTLQQSLSAADLHLVSMGEKMVGVVHPCKVYGALAVGRPVLLLGPRRCHIGDMLGEHQLGWQVDHGDTAGMERIIRTVANSDAALLEDMGKRAQQVVAERFGRAALIGQLCDVLARQEAPVLRS